MEKNSIYAFNKLFESLSEAMNSEKGKNTSPFRGDNEEMGIYSFTSFKKYHNGKFYDINDCICSDVDIEEKLTIYRKWKEKFVVAFSIEYIYVFFFSKNIIS